MIERARAAGIDTILAIGVTAESSAAVVRMAGEYPSIYAAVGIHPNYCAEAAAGDWDRVVALAGGPRVVALGETGLDRYRDHAPLELQQEYFDRHLRLSQERACRSSFTRAKARRRCWRCCKKPAAAGRFAA